MDRCSMDAFPNSSNTITVGDLKAKKAAEVEEEARKRAFRIFATKELNDLWSHHQHFAEDGERRADLCSRLRF